MKNCQIIDYGKINCRLYWNDDDNKRFLLSVYLWFCAKIKERVHNDDDKKMGKTYSTHIEINCQDFARNWKWWSRHHTKRAHKPHCELKVRADWLKQSNCLFFNIKYFALVVVFLILCFIVSIDLTIFVCTSHTFEYMWINFLFSHRSTALRVCGTIKWSIRQQQCCERASVYVFEYGIWNYEPVYS